MRLMVKPCSVGLETLQPSMFKTPVATEKGQVSAFRLIPQTSARPEGRKRSCCKTRNRLYLKQASTKTLKMWRVTWMCWGMQWVSVSVHIKKRVLFPRFSMSGTAAVFNGSPSFVNGHQRISKMPWNVVYMPSSDTPFYSCILPKETPHSSKGNSHHICLWLHGEDWPLSLRAIWKMGLRSLHARC